MLSNANAADGAVRRGLKQVEDNPGGIMLDYKGEKFDADKMIGIIDSRMRRGFVGTIDIMLLFKNALKFVRRYTKK